MHAWSAWERNRCVTSTTRGMAIALEKNRAGCIELLSSSSKWNLNPPPGGVRSIAMSVSVCLFVSQKQHVQTSQNCLYMLPMSIDRGSVLLWQQCNTLCTSGLQMFAPPPTGRLVTPRYALFLPQRLRRTTGDGGEVCYPRLHCLRLEQSRWSSQIQSHRVTKGVPKGYKWIYTPIDKIGFNNWCKICC